MLLLLMLLTPSLAESAGGQTSDRDMDSIESKNSMNTFGIKDNIDMSSKKERLTAVEKFLGKNLGAEDLGLCTIVSIGYQLYSTKHGLRNFKDTNPLMSFSLVILFGMVKYRGGQRYFFGGCTFARMPPFFIRPLALDRNDFKFASALSAIPR